MQRLGLANQWLVTGKRLREAPEPAVRIDVIDDNRATGS
jgi:hypothetical protein